MKELKKELYKYLEFKFIVLTSKIVSKFGYCVFIDLNLETTYVENWYVGKNK